MAPDQAAPVPAGWYPDPYKSSELRWWDGQNWTDSVHPPVVAAPAVAAPAVASSVPEPAVPEPAVPEPAVPEQVVPEPVAAEPVVPEPVVPEPVAAAEYIAPQVEPTYQPPVVPPLVEPVLGPTQTQDPEPAAEFEPEPPIETASELIAPELIAPELIAPEPVAPEPGLPSRRELRKRAEGESEGPLSAHASAPQAPTPDPSAPSAFDWMVTGAAAAQVTPSESPTPQVSPSQHGATAPTGFVAEPASASGPVPVSATSAWAQEPPVTTADPEDLYRSTATRKATVSGWFIAIMPLIAGVLAIGAVKGAENYPRYVPAGVEWWMLAGSVVVVLYLVTLLLAIADRRKLDWAGYNHPAHWAWAILTAPIYLLVRTIVVKRETGRNSALLWVWIALVAVLVAAWFAVANFAPELVDGYALPFL